MWESHRGDPNGRHRLHLDCGHDIRYSIRIELVKLAAPQCSFVSSSVRFSLPWFGHVAERRFRIDFTDHGSSAAIGFH